MKWGYPWTKYDRLGAWGTDENSCSFGRDWNCHTDSEHWITATSHYEPCLVKISVNQYQPLLHNHDETLTLTHCPVDSCLLFSFDAAQLRTLSMQSGPLVCPKLMASTRYKPCILSMVINHLLIGMIFRRYHCFQGRNHRGTEIVWKVKLHIIQHARHWMQSCQ